jgi:hypothetical protein
MGRRYVIYIAIVLLAITLFFSCKKEDENPPIVAINELMPLNNHTVADQDGEFDDWIELFNNSNQEIDLSDYYLSDSDKNITKWKFPIGTTISAKGYLIVWADGDTDQVGLHTNFRLSADGEEVVLSNPEMVIVDYVKFGAQSAELSFSRVPNGTGEFSWQQPTFNGPNGN